MLFHFEKTWPNYNPNDAGNIERPFCRPALARNHYLVVCQSVQRWD